MRKLLLVGAAAALGMTACAPDVGSELGSPPQAGNPNTENFVVAQFDPTGTPVVVPTPNDLALNPTTGLVNAPIDPNATPAMQEFTRDYLNTLNGFPTATPVTAKIADLDPSSIALGKGIRFIDLLAGTPIATRPVNLTAENIVYDDATDTLTIRPPAAGWPKGARYAVALVGGAEGLKGTNNRPVVGSATWAFARSAEPLVTCEDLTAPDCQTVTELIPSTKTDPTERLRDQTASALRLEQLRRAYRPLLEALEKQDVKREDVALLWTFRIVDQPEVTFDLSKGIIPFPNDILRVKGQDGRFRLNFPVPELAQDGSNAAQVALFTALNTLDGFSTTAPVVSENSNELGALESGSQVDPNTLAAGTRFLKLTNPTTGTQPNVTPCIGCASSRTAAGAPQTGPQQLQFVPQTPLDEQTQYAPLITTDLMDVRGRRVMPSALFALVRSASPLVDANGKSTLSVITDAQALQLEPVRLGFKPLFDALEGVAKIPRAKIALGWAFTTQSTVSVLRQLNALAGQYGQNGLPAAPMYIQDVTSAYGSVVPNAKVFQGSAFFPLALTGPSGTLNPTAPVFQRAPFLLTVPKSAEGVSTGNFPVTVFSHGLTGNRNNMLAIANSLAMGGRASIAIDTVFHGERANCASISASSPVVGLDGTTVFTSPDQACADTSQQCDVSPTSATFGRCIAKDPASRQACTPNSFAGDQVCKTLSQGLCLQTGADTGVCQGGDFKRTTGLSPSHPNYDQPLIGGAILNLSNLFATRDNFRHHVIETAQLVRVLSSAAMDTQLTAANGGTALTLDETQADYLGQSLGGILGGLTVPVTPELKRAVLNVPGADPVGILLTSQTPRFVQARNAFVGRLAAQGMPQGSPGFDTFITLARTIMDPADPQNAGYALADSQKTVPGRSVFVQYIENDPVTPNPMTEKLINAANRHPTHKVATTKFTFADPATLAVEKRHGFLLDPSVTPAVIQTAQSQVVNFLATGNTPAAETKF